MRFLKRITLIAVCVSLFYILLSMGLSFTELSLRTWVKTLGRVIVWLVTPGMILFLALYYLYGNERVHEVVRVVCTAAAVIVGGIYVFYIFFFILILSGMEEERMLTSHLLVTDESFLKTNPVYYRPVAFFFKRPGEITTADQLEYLEKKYKRAFEISRSGNAFYDVTLPEVQVAVVPDGMSLADNYVESITLHSLLEVYRTVDMERDYHIVEPDEWKYLCLEASGYDDIPALSEDLLCLAAGAMSGGFSSSAFDAAGFFQEYRGKVYFSFGKDAESYTGSISFGGKDGEWPIDVEDVVRIAYDRQENGRQGEAQEPYQSTGEDDSAGEGDETASDQETQMDHESEVESDYREEAAKAVYDAALAEEGFSYEVYYNAKGNLYIDLGNKTSEEDGKVYSYLLVYDRPSKNGACELLVLYRSVEGSDNEAIVDMYAVETATGKVVASGRKAWSDVGTKEYREMTGE
ncbi:MAG: ABC transporter permease [Lachnospiraceae bacterium]|nr:ABC transporter permease [Lachnospiraceae bacterium]